MIFSSSPFSQSSLLIPIPIPKPNQPNKSPLSICSAKMASSSFPSSTLPPNLSPTSPNPKSSSFYEVLGIPMGATTEEIKAAYRKLARVCHPDVASKDAPPDDFIKIHTAYSTLSDPDKRTDYDHRILYRRTAPNATRGPLYSRQKWETDQCW